MTTKQVTIPITGMTCANCVAAIERVTQRVPGVIAANVNMSSERGTFEIDADRVSAQDVIAKIGDIGYGVATAQVDLPLRGLHDDNDARVVENALRAMASYLHPRG